MNIELVDHPAGTVRIITLDSGDKITQQAVMGCTRCATDGWVQHFTCLYAGKAMGHSESHCTANACY